MGNNLSALCDWEMQRSAYEFDDAVQIDKYYVREMIWLISNRLFLQAALGGKTYRTIGETNWMRVKSCKMYPKPVRQTSELARWDQLLSFHASVNVQLGSDRSIRPIGLCTFLGQSSVLNRLQLRSFEQVELYFQALNGCQRSLMLTCGRSLPTPVGLAQLSPYMWTF